MEVQQARPFNLSFVIYILAKNEIKRKKIIIAFSPLSPIFALIKQYFLISISLLVCCLCSPG